MSEFINSTYQQIEDATKFIEQLQEPENGKEELENMSEEDDHLNFIYQTRQFICEAERFIDEQNKPPPKIDQRDNLKFCLA